jgi:hypothetical protein
MIQGGIASSCTLTSTGIDTTKAHDRPGGSATRPRTSTPQHMHTPPPQPPFSKTTFCLRCPDTDIVQFPPQYLCQHTNTHLTQPPTSHQHTQHLTPSECSQQNLHDQLTTAQVYDKLNHPSGAVKKSKEYPQMTLSIISVSPPQNTTHLAHGNITHKANAKQPCSV